MTKPVSSRVCRSVGEASELLKLIANANRLAIVCYLMETEASVSALEEELGIRQPTLSQQLTELREAGVIEGRREGNRKPCAAPRRAISSSRSGEIMAPVLSPTTPQYRCRR